MLSDVKSELITLMKKNEEITVREASKPLGLAISTVRQHLLGLELDGYIASTDRRQGVGRPQKVYFLTEKGNQLFPDVAKKVLPKLLEYLCEEGLRSEVTEFFRNYCDEEAREWSYQIRGRGEERIGEIVSFLAQKGYSPEAGVDEEGQRYLELHHCPFQVMLETTQVMCDCKRKALTEVLGCKVRHKRSIASGAASCRFLIESDEEGMAGD